MHAAARLGPLALAAGGLVPLLLAGCATTGRDIARLERQVRELRDQVYALEQSRAESERRLARLEGSGDGATLPAPPGGAVAGERPPVLAEPQARPAGGAGPAPGPGNGPGADRDWEEAKKVYDETRFAQAIPLLGAFIASHPGDPRAADAQYLVGESYYAEANFPQAIVEFGRVPAGPRAAEALYKASLCYYELGYDQNALEHLERLEKAYPGSAPARAAESLLEKLRKRRRK